MARKRSKSPPSDGNPTLPSAAPREEISPKGQHPNGRIHNTENPGQHSNRWARLFSEMACKTAHFAGKPLAFLAAVLVVAVWSLTGPLFGYSDTWQLVINTSTTIVTFLMVFLIQHTQNRDTMAVQLKLAELIMAATEAENRLATAEDLSEEELEELHKDFQRRAEELDRLKQHRARLKHA